MSIDKDIYKGPPKRHSGERHDKKYIVIHNTSNDASAKDEASYARHRTDGVNSHYYVDNNEVIQSLDTDIDAWHVGSPEGNRHGIAYEITGTNSKSRSWWLGNVAWSKLRAQMTKDCREHNIVPRVLSIAQIKEGKLTGIITHDQARRAWGHTTHTDPGENFPLDMLIGGAPETPKPSQPKPTQGWTDKLMSDLPTLKRGSKGDAVKRAQALLNTYGAGLKEDGIFGPNTGRETRDFQRAMGLVVDEWIGKNTWTRLVKG